MSWSGVGGCSSKYMNEMWLLYKDSNWAIQMNISHWYQQETTMTFKWIRQMHGEIPWIDLSKTRIKQWVGFISTWLKIYHLTTGICCDGVVLW